MQFQEGAAPRRCTLLQHKRVRREDRLAAGTLGCCSCSMSSSTSRRSSARKAQQLHKSASILTILRAYWAAWLSRGSAKRSNPPMRHSDTSSVGASSREMSTAPVQGMVSTRGAMETRATALACRAGQWSSQGRGSQEAVHFGLPAAAGQSPGPEIAFVSASAGCTIQVYVQEKQYLEAVPLHKGGSLKLDRVQHGLSHSWPGG